MHYTRKKVDSLPIINSFVVYSFVFIRLDWRNNHDDKLDFALAILERRPVAHHLA